MPRSEVYNGIPILHDLATASGERGFMAVTRGFPDAAVYQIAELLYVVVLKPGSALQLTEGSE
jgi:hypothetical protein